VPEDSKAVTKDAEDGGCEFGAVDLLSGRVGCQAAVVKLPRSGTQYPLSSDRCLVAIGGERCDRQADTQLFARALNLDTGVWCKPDVLPPSTEPPRTAVSICMAAGRVAGARLQRIPSA
jgi:hypothetical protein